MYPSSRRGLLVRAVFTTLAFFVFIAGAQAQGAVDIDFEVTGDAVPAGTVQVTADVTINDGSTLQSYSWMQIGGVEAMLSGTGSQTVTAALGTQGDYKAYLIHVLMEPPITEEQLPPNVPVPEGEFPGGLQDRFQVVAIDPYSLEHAQAVVLEVEVVTSSGTYHGEAHVNTALPWKVATGLLNVPIGAPVLLHGVEQDSYSWTLSAPGGSGAMLTDATTQNPEFTPDIPGHYTVEVDQAGTKELLSMAVYAGEWVGVIVGQDEDGRPVADSSCTGCHGGSFAEDVFSEWAQTGHAEIFSSQITTSAYWGERCFACHTVGYDPGADNDGIDDADDYHAFLDSGLIGSQSPDAWSDTLTQFPHTARKANIQCENCHGPQTGGAHLPNDPQGTPRVSLSSGVCATCHGEPPRHGRYQQWQLSPHANYELAIDEGSSGSCSRCHTGNGFLAWLPVLNGDVPGDPTDNVDVTWTTDEVHPQTCQTCHDPHAIGTTSGDGSNATVRISGDTPPLIAGFTATDVGRGAICMTCHNTRRGLRNDNNFNTEVYGTSEASRAPHPGAQADMLMGQNLYLIDVGQRANHSLTVNVEDTCVTCHMEETPPPADISYNQSGSNHTFYASPDICRDCHTNLAPETIQGPVEEQLHELEMMIVNAFFEFFEDQFDAGNSIDFGGTVVSSYNDLSEIELSESRGRQALVVTLADHSVIGPTAANSIDVVPPAGEPYEIYRTINPFVIKSFWNYLMVESDGSLGVHNPNVTFQVLGRSMAALESGLEPCAPDADTLCLHNGRFKAEVSWTDYNGGTGPGMVAQCGTDDSGIFYFFNEDNWEMLFKVLNGCGYNNHYWVYFAATTDVGFNVRVTDTLTGFTKAYSSKSGTANDYTNELGHPANAITDNTAFATCP